jgi:hypothetical protein
MINKSNKKKKQPDGAADESISNSIQFDSLFIQVLHSIQLNIPNVFSTISSFACFQTTIENPPVSTCRPLRPWELSPRYCRELHCVLGSPLPSSTVVPGSVCFQQLRNIWDQRIVWVGVGQKRADGEQDLADGQCRTPLVLQNVKTDSSVGIDVAVVDPRRKVHLRWLERVVRWEVNVQEEDSSCIWRVIGPHDRGLPVEHVVADWAC